MEETTLTEQSSKSTGLKIFSILFFVLLFAVLGFYSWFIIGSVQARVSSLPKNDVALDSNLVKLMKEKSWIASRLQMASSDSIGLSIDLEEKNIQLELKGLVVMKAPIQEFTASGFFKQMDANSYFTMFGTPLSVLGLESSIPKSPFKIVIAPKNEAEADSMSMKKDSVITGDIYWTINLNRDIELNIHGLDSISTKIPDYRLDKNFLFRRRFQNILSSIDHIIKLEKPNYTPQILISISKNQARAILRALPKEAMITIKI